MCKKMKNNQNNNDELKIEEGNSTQSIKYVKYMNIKHEYKILKKNEIQNDVVITRHQTVEEVRKSS